MNTSAFHLNLLKETEKLSSSPVRLRVMLPVGALLSCAGIAVWWGTLFTQLMLAQSQSGTIEDTLKAKGAAHAAIIKEMDIVRELRLEAEQLAAYSSGVRRVAAPLAHLAEVMPLKVQLTELSIPQPPPMDLNPPKGQKGPPAWGPTGTVETARLVLAGRTTKETPVISLMEALGDPSFSPLDTSEKKVKSFRQDAADSQKRKLLSFEIEYVMPERRFGK